MVEEFYHVMQASLNNYYSAKKNTKESLDIK